MKVGGESGRAETKQMLWLIGLLRCRVFNILFRYVPIFVLLCAFVFIFNLPVFGHFEMYLPILHNFACFLGTFANQSYISSTYLLPELEGAKSSYHIDACFFCNLTPTLVMISCFQPRESQNRKYIGFLHV